VIGLEFFYQQLRKPLSIWLTGGVLACAAIYGAIHIMESAYLPTMPLVTLHGDQVSLSSVAAGKPMVLNLWASWCAPCREEMPLLAAAQRQEGGVQFVFANQGEDRTTIQRFLFTARLDLTNVLVDPGARIGREAGSIALPITFFYDDSGRLVDTNLGALTADLMAAKLDRIRSHSFKSGLTQEKRISAVGAEADFDPGADGG
jgi:thiol-disulfide isomerase/thioredoxin